MALLPRRFLVPASKKGPVAEFIAKQLMCFNAIGLREILQESGNFGAGRQTEANSFPVTK